MVDFLRRRHPERTAENVAAETGVKLETARKWLKGRNGIGGRAMLQLVAAYGRDLLEAAFPAGLEWLEGADAAKEEELARAEYQSLAARLAVLEARLAAPAADQDRAAAPPARTRRNGARRDDRALDLFGER